MKESWIDKFTHGFFWFGFCVFLGASIPHIAAYFRHFDPNVTVASFEDIKNWVVSYLIAIVIDVTDVLVSVAVMKAMKNGAKMRNLWGYWAFIAFIMALSWLINWEYNVEFQTNMFANADKMPIFGIHVSDINPVIGSAFQLLVLVYTAMAHKITENTAPKTAQQLKLEADELEQIAVQQARINASKSALNANKVDGFVNTLVNAKESARKLFVNDESPKDVTNASPQDDDNSGDALVTERDTGGIETVTKLVDFPGNSRKTKTVTKKADSTARSRVLRLLKKFPDKTNAEIAVLAKVHKSYVSRIKATLVEEERNRA